MAMILNATVLTGTIFSLKYKRFPVKYPVSHGMIHRKFDKIKIATLSCWAKAWKIASKNE